MKYEKPTETSVFIYLFFTDKSLVIYTGIRILYYARYDKSKLIA